MLAMRELDPIGNTTSAVYLRSAVGTRAWPPYGCARGSQEDGSHATCLSVALRGCTRGAIRQSSEKCGPYGACAGWGAKNGACQLAVEHMLSGVISASVKRQWVMKGMQDSVTKSIVVIGTCM